MKRRSFLSAAAGVAFAAAAPARRPNILILTTDQQSADAMSWRIGERYLKTPHMDSLAASGIAFTRAYCANPLCVPSRTSIYTGRYPVETGIETNDDVRRTLDWRRFPCLASVFRDAGYETGYFGKWHLPFAENKTDTHGFAIVNSKRANRDAGVAEAAAAFITNRREKPFLAVASFLNPHNICQWARGEAMTEGEIGAPPPPAECPPWRANHATPENETDTMLLMRRSYQSTDTFPVGNFDENKWRQYLWAYYRMIELVDARIGQVLQALHESGAGGNTLVVLTADHGDCQGAHGWNQKTVFYEEAARVPFILSWKGLIPYAVSDRLVHTGIDLLPTLCDYAGVERPRGLPGLSLKTAANRDYVVVSNEMAQGAAVGGRVPKPRGRMVRTDRYKYCVYSEGTRRESLVDLGQDPGETRNVAGEDRMAGELARHRRILAEWCAKFRDQFPLMGSSKS